MLSCEEECVNLRDDTPRWVERVTSSLGPPQSQSLQLGGQQERKSRVLGECNTLEEFRKRGTEGRSVVGFLPVEFTYREENRTLASLTAGLCLPLNHATVPHALHHFAEKCERRLQLHP